MGRRASSFEGRRGGGQPFQQPFSFNFDDLFADFDMFGQNQHFKHSQQKRRFESHFQQRAPQGRHRQHFQGSFGAGLFDDVFENMERMFSFDMPRADGGFHRSAKQHCRTVTQRRGNMVTTYTDCS